MNVNSRVLIPVMDSMAMRTFPFADFEILYILVFASTDRTQLTGRIESVNRYDPLAIPFSFVCKLTAKFAPAGIRDGLRQLMIAPHVLHGEVFDAHNVVLPDDLRGYLVHRVSPLVGNVLIQVGDLHAVLLIAAAPHCFSGELPLETSQPLFTLFQIPEIDVFISI